MSVRSGRPTSGHDARSVGGSSKSSAVHDRLRATEAALKVAQEKIASHEKREKDLKRMLIAKGIAEEAHDSNPVLEAKVDALKKIHDQKVRSLMKSINQLQEQLQGLKTQDKEHRRSALIQNLRKQQKEQDLVIDVLKQALVEKVPEFQNSRDLVNDFIIKKSVGGPLRFRPKTREELESELETLDQKYKIAVSNLKKAQSTRASQARDASPSPQKSSKCDEEQMGQSLRQPGDTESAQEIEMLKQDVDRLRVELAAKDLTIQSQNSEITHLYTELDRFRLMEEKVERKKKRVEHLEASLQKFQDESLALMQEKELESEKVRQLQEELQFMKDTRIDDVTTGDQERLEQLELIQKLRARELELQCELEEQQRKWATDRTAIHQQLRLKEKELQLLEEEKKRVEADRAAGQKRGDTLSIELERLQITLQELKSEKEMTMKRLQELEQLQEKFKTLSMEQRDAAVREMTVQQDELRRLLTDKESAAKQLERQLNASKLLVRQAKKEKEQLQMQVEQLELAATQSTGSSQKAINTPTL